MGILSDNLAAISAFVALGGPVVAILLGVSVVALAVILAKAVQFWRAHVGWRKRAERAVWLWQHGRPREAFDHAAAGRSSASRAVALSIRLGMGGRMARADVEERVARQVAQDLHDLQSGFRLLDAVVQLSPLLGLFGTVLGMIEAFRQLQGAGNAVDPSILAGGIWVALLTTAAGLAVAMPVSVALTWLESRVDDERIAIETLTADILAAPPGGATGSMREAAIGEGAVLAH